MNSGDDYVRKPDSVGPAGPRLRRAPSCPTASTATSPPTDLPAGPDVTGELWIKGPNVVRGYWNKPEATAATFTRGWLHSGDVARIDEEGFVYIVDRAKDMVIRGGENVYSVEVEAALFEHPAVADCRGHRRAPRRPGRGGRRGGGPAAGGEGDRRGARPLRRGAAGRVQGARPLWFRPSRSPAIPPARSLKRELRAELLGDQR